jgi:RNase P subunit RPR2
MDFRLIFANIRKVSDFLQRLLRLAPSQMVAQLPIAPPIEDPEGDGDGVPAEQLLSKFQAWVDANPSVKSCVCKTKKPMILLETVMTVSSRHGGKSIDAVTVACADCGRISFYDADRLGIYDDEDEAKED